jgi:hypothetical protein
VELKRERLTERRGLRPTPASRLTIEWLYLNDLGTEVSEHERTDRPSLIVCEVNYTDTLEWTAHIVLPV